MNIDFDQDSNVVYLYGSSMGARPYLLREVKVRQRSPLPEGWVAPVIPFPGVVSRFAFLSDLELLGVRRISHLVELNVRMERPVLDGAAFAAAARDCVALFTDNVGHTWSHEVIAVSPQSSYKVILRLGARRTACNRWEDRRRVVFGGAQVQVPDDGCWLLLSKGQGTVTTPVLQVPSRRTS